MTFAKGRYVERSGTSCHRPPYACDGTQLFGFVLRGDARVLQERLVDPALNEPSGRSLDYRVVSPFVLVTFAWVDRGRCVGGPDELLGSTAEGSCTIWILTARRAAQGLQLAFHVPYIVVDNPWSMAAGREVYGFPKSFGTLRRTGTLDRIERLEASAWAVDSPGREARAEERPLIVIDRVPGDERREAPPLREKLDWARRLVTDVVLGASGPGTPSRLDLVASCTAAARRRVVPTVFLKQFRDAEDSERACYQALIEVEASVTRLRSVRLLPGRFRASLAELATHPIRTDLGLSGETTDVELSFHLDYDFTIGHGREVWTASARV